MDTPGFTLFWAAWPRNVAHGYSRKGAKQECAKLWARGDCEAQAGTICRHVEWLKDSPDWQKEGGMYIPAPAVYLRQMRWDGADIPEPAQNATQRLLAEQAAHKGAPPSPEQRDRIQRLASSIVRRVA